MLCDDSIKLINVFNFSIVLDQSEQMLQKQTNMEDKKFVILK